VASPTNPIPMRKHIFFEGPHGLARWKNDVSHLP
jgi:hypothetical protein